MTDNLRIVPVVAHRLYGTHIVESALIPRRRRPIGLPHLGDDLGPGGISTRTVLLPDIDRSIGTTVTLDEVRAFFAPASEPDYTRGYTVNDLFPRLLQFRLIEIVDNMVESHLADLLLADSDFTHLMRPGALNLFFVHDIEGYLGYALHAGVYVSDCLGDEDVLGQDGRWRRRVNVIAHEFGHILGLGHTPHVENLMYAYAVRLADVAFEPPQLRIMHHISRHVAMAGPVAEAAPHIAADWRRDLPYADRTIEALGALR